MSIIKRNRQLKDVKTFLTNVKIDNMCGMYSMDEQFPRRTLKVYDDKHEVNVILDMSANIATSVIIGKLRFDGDKVSMIQVNKWVPENAASIMMSVNIDVEGSEFLDLCNKSYGPYGPMMYNVIMEMVDRGYKIKYGNKIVAMTDYAKYIGEVLCASIAD